MLSFVVVMPKTPEVVETALSPPLTMNVPVIEPEVEPTTRFTLIDPSTEPCAWKSPLVTMALKLSTVDIGVGEGEGDGEGDGVGEGEGDGDGVGVAKTTTPQRVVVDYSSPNVAKQMQNKCLCPLGEFSTMSVVTGIERFPQDFKKVVQPGFGPVPDNLKNVVGSNL